MKRTALLLLVGFISFTTFSQKIEDITVETSYLTYPRIPVKDINWSGITAEVAHNSISLGDKKVLKGTNLCKAKGASIKDAKAIENFYYNINYKTPAAILRVNDASGKVLFSKYTSNGDDSQVLFGKDECYFIEQILVDIWKKQEEGFTQDLATDEYKAVTTEAQNFIDQAVMFHYVPEQVEVFSPKTNKDHNYDSLLEVAQQAAKGYELLNNDYENAEGKALLEKSIAAWEKELEETNLNDRKSRINKKVAGTLRANMALAYAYLQKYDDAIVQSRKALNIYAGTTNNRTMKWEALNDRCREQNTYYLMNKDAEVDLSEHKVVVENKGMDAFDTFKSDYNTYASNQQGNELMAAKEAHDKAVDSGELNKYEGMITQSATQGYMLMYMSFQKLGEFPVEVCDLTQLNYIYFKGQDIETIPTEIKKLQNLKKLDLSKNKITAIPDELGELKELKSLILKGNPLPQSELDKVAKLLPDCKVKF
ncbi:leucine-rich repeat domain-containing protein [Carboxylicivirga linearis]|uniref:Leucine-rich repeat domain-containing protein n=1 Tax=Carboxylicivirga linearis TaxID=1628157 RepID=A0ABS5JNX7_9BACT|nr:tetratricopeptide repeat protein [Carboxylicivirga linearis]MBS2096636.1 leucine-rich repeat domain-containing protein [Carboxylicivirga linearis]